MLTWYVWPTTLTAIICKNLPFITNHTLKNLQDHYFLYLTIILLIVWFLYLLIIFCNIPKFYFLSCLMKLIGLSRAIFMVLIKTRCLPCIMYYIGYIKIDCTIYREYSSLHWKNFEKKHLGLVLLMGYLLLSVVHISAEIDRLPTTV